MESENNSNPLVSVVVATRNRFDWLQQCVQSVQSQKNVSWELIIVDDASTDRPGSWFGELECDQIRIHRFEEQRERCAARNQGLAMAKGRYVMFLDDDDWLWPDGLRLLSSALEDNEAVASVGGRWAVFTGEDYERRDAHPRRILSRNILDELLFGWSAVSGQNLYRKSIIRSVGGYEDEKQILCEDRLLWLRVAVLGNVVLIPEVIMSYRYHDNQKRPADIQTIRDRVARRVIRSLPKEERRKSLKLRRSGRLVEQAEDEMSHGNPLLAAWMTGRALLSTPRIFVSPLIGEWVLRRLGGRLYRRFFPA